jgi:hypothetical protein
VAALRCLSDPGIRTAGSGVPPDPAGGDEQPPAVRLGDQLVLPVAHLCQHQVWVGKHASMVGR